jgi:hypothetical protein
MLITARKRPANRTLLGWASNVLDEAGAIRETAYRRSFCARPDSSLDGDDHRACCNQTDAHPSRC